jgi:hypothetical protein
VLAQLQLHGPLVRKVGGRIIAAAMRTRFTRAVARVVIAIGILIVLLAAALAVLSFVVPAETLDLRPLPLRVLFVRWIMAGVFLVTGLALGAAFIVVGQLLLVFLDIRRRLARIDRRLHRWELSAEQGRESRWTERLRPR